MNQKGFSILLSIFFVFIALLLLLVILFTSNNSLFTQFFTKNHFNQVQNIKSEEQTASSSLSSLGLNQDKIVYIAKNGMKLNLALVDGSNINLLVDSIKGGVIGISKSSDSKYFLVKEQDNLNSIGNSTKYALLDSSLNYLKDIDLQTFQNKYGTDKSLVTIQKWSEDGHLLLVNIFGWPKSIFIWYNPDSNDTGVITQQEVSGTKSLSMNIFFYNSGQKIYVYGLNNDKQYHLKSTVTNNDEAFDSPNVVDMQNGLGAYFVKSNASNFNTLNATQLNVYSIYEPNKSIAQINLKENNRVFGNSVSWSSDYQFFTISVRDPRNIYQNTTAWLNIYKRDGALVQSKELKYSWDQYFGGLFSPDNKYFLLLGNTSTSNYKKLDVPIWQLMDINSGEIVTNRNISEDLGQAYYWISSK